MKHFLVFDAWISYQKYISTVKQCGDIFKKNIINVIFIYIIIKLLIKLFMTSPVRPPVGPGIREPLPFPVLFSVRFLKPWYGVRSLLFISGVTTFSTTATVSPIRFGAELVKSSLK